jgi:hypothetical protein
MDKIYTYSSSLIFFNLTKIKKNPENPQNQYNPEQDYFIAENNLPHRIPLLW